MAEAQSTSATPTEEAARMRSLLEALNADPGRLVVRNEFAVVAVAVHETGNGRSRLLIEDLRTRQTVELDALELESLAWSRHQDLDPLLDPSRSRWNGTEPSSEPPESTAS